MSKSFITTKYGTKINVAGLTPAQIEKVRSTAEDKGPYGLKASKLADQYRAQAKKTAGQGTPAAPAAPTTPAQPSTGINKTTGQIDPGVILDNPVLQATDLSADVTQARDAAYNYITKDYATNKAQEIEAKKQELSDRGIPIDPSPDSLWGRTLAEIDKKYQGLDDQAKNQAIGAGNDILGTESGVKKNAADTFLSAVLGMSDADLKLYGINKDYQAKLKAIAASRNSGGGGGGSSTDPIIGNQAP